MTPRLKLFSVLAIFVIPMVLAAIFFYRGQPIGHTTNYGQLLRPPIPIKSVYASNNKQPLPHKWTLLWYTPNKCDSDQCRDYLKSLNQIWKATGKYQTKTHIGVLSLWQNHNDPELTQFLQGKHNISQVFTTQTQFRQGKTGLYLVDPQGYIMMHYPQDANQLYVFKDLKKLLRIN